MSKFFLKKYQKKNFINACKKMNINIQDELYKPVYKTPEFGWKSSMIKVNYKNTKCKNAESILKNKVVWLNFIHFIGDKNFLDQILKSFKIIFNNLKI